MHGKWWRLYTYRTKKEPGAFSGWFSTRDSNYLDLHVRVRGAHAKAKREYESDN